uniref:Uncharacterized protein n=1 Tax=Glossina pallidipes TaxID=7398 RepID=A0A1A9ZWU2_GLOPL
MTAGLPNELFEFLEKIILDSSAFSDRHTAFKANRTRTMDYINHHAPDIANIAISKQLCEKAFAIFKKFDVNTSAIKCLSNKSTFWNGLMNLLSLAMSQPFGRKLAKAQLEKGLVKEAIDLSINVDDLGAYMHVVGVASQADSWDDLLRYLQMARKKARESYIENELIYAYVGIGRLADLEEFLSGPNHADIQKIGERCFDDVRCR